MVTPPGHRGTDPALLPRREMDDWHYRASARTSITALVRRALAQAGLPRVGPPPRPSKIDAYLAFIRQSLGELPGR